jgi:hypothetical protein
MRPLTPDEETAAVTRRTHQTTPASATPRLLLALALSIVVAAPLAARAAPRLLESELRDPLRELSLSAAPDEAKPDDAADAQHQKEQERVGKKPAGGAKTSGGSLDFDLLGDAPPPPPTADLAALHERRTMLNVHQGLGFGLVGLQLATTVVGQLNYSDKFSGPNSNQYKMPHALLSYATLAVFATNGALALLAPSGGERAQGFDRATLHKVAMFAAAAGMLAQGILGATTTGREGYQNQQDLATVHLVIGYVTLAAVTAGVSALVF